MLHGHIHGPIRLDGLDAARLFFEDCFSGLDPSREYLFVAHLDANAHCLHLSCYPGDASGVPVSTRIIVGEAIRHGSAGLVLAHNHPSGDSRPSDSDRQLTRRLALVVEAIDCQLIEHLIFAGTECTSFRKMGLL